MNDIFNYKKSNSDDFYHILGCDQSSSTEQIICEYKNRALRLHPDKQHNSEDTQELFKKLVKAKDILTDPESRKSYDKWRNSGVAIPYDKWSQMGRDVHNSMHWINKTKSELMLENRETVEIDEKTSHSTHNNSFQSFKFWNNEYNNPLITKFRNYQI